jgi:murein DD-endopeptidase MepM/ murein hydrolase activator NlpD
VSRQGFLAPTGLTLTLTLALGAAAFTATALPTAASAQDRARMAVAETTPQKTFFDAKRRARFAFELRGNQRRNIIVKALRVGNQQVKRRWRFENVRPGERQVVRWNGKKRPALGGGFIRQGRHVFKVFQPGGKPADTSNADGRQRFRHFRHKFPVRGRVTWGDGMGAGRGHQGQDLFARCGTRVEAARGGRVKHRGFHGRAGYYIVVAGRDTGRDYVYMHLQKKGRPKQGARIRTGQRVGRVGETGNASGCHLHFELWSAPGWYNGGRPVNPTPPLRRWRGWS